MQLVTSLVGMAFMRYIFKKNKTVLPCLKTTMSCKRIGNESKIQPMFKADVCSKNTLFALCVNGKEMHFGRKTA